MAADSAFVIDEVQVVAADLDPLRVGREAEADQGAADVAQLEDVLLGDDLGQRPVRRFLPWHGAEAERIEAAVDSYRAGSGVVADQLVKPLQQLLVREGPGEGRVDLRLEPGDDREGGPRAGGHGMDAALDVGPVEATVERDHLAIETVQRAQPEVAVLGQLAEAEVAVVSAVEQGGDGRGLEEDVRLALPVQVRPSHRLDVEGLDPAFIEHRGSLSARRASIRTQAMNSGREKGH